MYDLIIDILHTVMRNGLTLSSIGAVLILLLKNRRLKRYLNHHLPKMLRDYDDETLRRMESKLDLLLRERGVQWNGSGKTSLKLEAKNSNRLSFLLHKAFLQGSTLRRMKRMSNKWKSRKFWIAIVSAGILIAKEGLGIEVDSETVIAFTGIVLTWILGESHVDAKRAGNTTVEDDTPKLSH